MHIDYNCVPSVIYTHPVSSSHRHWSFLKSFAAFLPDLLALVAWEVCVGVLVFPVAVLAFSCFLSPLSFSFLSLLSSSFPFLFPFPPSSPFSSRFRSRSRPRSRFRSVSGFRSRPGLRFCFRSRFRCRSLSRFHSRFRSCVCSRIWGFVVSLLHRVIVFYFTGSGLGRENRGDAERRGAIRTTTRET